MDMRSEGRKGKGIPILSQQLKEAIEQRLEKKRADDAFLNRRGYASSLQCPKCGFVAGCPQCSVSLTYHRRQQRLRCHLCGHDEHAPLRCPQSACQSPEIRFAGVGTERVEETLIKLYPRATLRRMDSDTLKKKEDYKRILTEFRQGKVDILIGTQMIAKGLHFPNVTLVGIIYADLSLHIPDFRSGERTFQLITQVAGRAGRGEVEGRRLCAIADSVSSRHSRPSPRLHWILRTGVGVSSTNRLPAIAPSCARDAQRLARGENPPKCEPHASGLGAGNNGPIRCELFWPSPCASGTRRKPLSISDPGAGPPHAAVECLYG